MLFYATQFVICYRSNRKLIYGVERNKKYDHPFPIAMSHIFSTVLLPGSVTAVTVSPGSLAFWLPGYQTVSGEQHQDVSSPTLYFHAMISAVAALP